MVYVLVYQSSYKARNVNKGCVRRSIMNKLIFTDTADPNTLVIV